MSEYTAQQRAEYEAGILAGINDALDGNPYNPGVEPVEANIDTLDGYQHGWHVAHQEACVHDAVIKLTRENNHGYPYRAVCDCGWESPSYVALHAASNMGEWHLRQQIMRNFPEIGVR